MRILNSSGRFMALLVLASLVCAVGGCANSEFPSKLGADRVFNGDSHSIASEQQHNSFHAWHRPEPTLPSLVTLGPNEDLFELIRSVKGPVLVDFYADWCGPCRKQGSILHDLESTATENEALIVKVDVDQHQQLAQHFDVQSLPTLVLLKNEKIIERQTGLADSTRIASLLSR